MWCSVVTIFFVDISFDAYRLDGTFEVLLGYPGINVHQAVGTVELNSRRDWAGVTSFQVRGHQG